jgi:hypothetical protein
MRSLYRPGIRDKPTCGLFPAVGRPVALQPLSVEASAGANLAAGIAGMTLAYAP